MQSPNGKHHKKYKKMKFWDWKIIIFTSLLLLFSLSVTAAYCSNAEFSHYANLYSRNCTVQTDEVNQANTDWADGWLDGLCVIDLMWYNANQSIVPGCSTLPGINMTGSCTLTNNTLSINCTMNSTSNWRLTTNSVELLDPTNTSCSITNTDWNTCGTSKNSVFTPANCAILHDNTVYRLKFTYWNLTNCSIDANQVTQYGNNITTYQCYPDELMNPGFVCTNNTITASVGTPTQAFWSVTPQSVPVNTAVNFQVQYQTLGSIGLGGANCSIIISTLNVTYPLSTTSNNGTYVRNIIFPSAGAYTYYATCNKTNETNGTSYISATTSTKSFYVIGAFATTSLVVVTSTLTNHSFGNGSSYSPASTWDCTNPMMRVQSGDVFHGCLCPFVIMFGPEVFFGLIMLCVMVMAYIKTRIWEAPGILALIWVGAFIMYFPPISIIILSIAVSIGLATIFIGLFNKEQ